MMSSETKIEQELLRRMQDYVDMLGHTAPSEDYQILRYKRRCQIIDLMIQHQISRISFVCIIGKVIQNNPDKASNIVDSLVRRTINEVSELHYLKGNLTELMWYIPKIEKADEIVSAGELGDVVRIIGELAGRLNARRYLNHLLISSSPEKHEKIIWTYYYCGHDTESIYLAISYLPENDLRTLGTFVTHLEQQFTHPKNTVKLSKDDKVLLVDFLENKKMFFTDSDLVDQLIKTLENN
ncbi:MAG: hypothetical protein AAFV93_10975 [Chloroflexota bacterium]